MSGWGGAFSSIRLEAKIVSWDDRWIVDLYRRRQKIELERRKTTFKGRGRSSNFNDKSFRFIYLTLRSTRQTVFDFRSFTLPQSRNQAFRSPLKGCVKAGISLCHFP